MKTKKCNYCKKEKPFSEYHKKSSSIDGMRSTCKECRKEKGKTYREKYKDVLVERRRRFRKKHPEKIAEWERRKWKKHGYKYKILNYKRDKERYNTEPLYKLKNNLRGRLYKALMKRGMTKKNTTESILGISYEGLKQHLEKQFKPGMTWDNHSANGWHIDHKIPLSSAKTKEGMLKLSHYTNLQPLWARENKLKGCKING